jgi:hypothetical protein
MLYHVSHPRLCFVEEYVLTIRVFGLSASRLCSVASTRQFLAQGSTNKGMGENSEPPGILRRESGS